MSEDAREYFVAAFPEMPLSVQSPGDLGHRLADAFPRPFDDGAERAVIIGADSPTLPVQHLSDGLAAMRELRPPV
ncbi:MAG: DUF2064 domain-containing protein [Gemmatimonadota bacterium]